MLKNRLSSDLGSSSEFILSFADQPADEQRLFISELGMFCCACARSVVYECSGASVGVPTANADKAKASLWAVPGFSGC